MKRPSNRLSQDAVADAVSAAVDLEVKRIESLDPETLDLIAGGDTTGGSGATMGYVPPTL